MGITSKTQLTIILIHRDPDILAAAAAIMIRGGAGMGIQTEVLPAESSSAPGRPMQQTLVSTCRLREPVEKFLEEAKRMLAFAGVEFRL